MSGAGRLTYYRSEDGLRLAARIFDAPEAGALPVLCLPGLSRNSRDFIALGEYLSSGEAEPPRRVIAVDYRGRGHSDADSDWRNYTPAVEALDVLAAADALGLGEVVVVGTSRGGIISMLIGALRPALLAGVVLNDIGPVIEADGLARIKAYLADWRPVATWDEAVAALRRNAAGQFPALRDEDWRAYAEAYLAPTSNGMLAPQFDGNLNRAIAGMGGPDPIPELWPQFESLAAVPVLAIRGEFSDILSPSTLGAMSKRLPRLEQLVVPGQGHAPLLRDPPTLERIADFARRCDGP